ncbi:YegP family protein [Haloplanus halophilus]|uniref:YegP family protein n=1 Tax=Haloplanus halophilus TaxID=2949993 RepID=UPI00203A98AB|nr:YegP family protein [Haloplanus sp. GDY1]
MPEATFQVFETDAGEFRWRLRDDDGSILATSGEAYPTKGAATRRLQRVKHTAPTAGVESV